MADDTPKTVKVEALQWHTHQGTAYDVGDTYDIDEQLVDSVQFQGKAVRVDRVQHAKAAAKEAERSAKTAAKAPKAPRAAKTPRKTAVSPMTTTTTRALTPRKRSK